MSQIWALRPRRVAAALASFLAVGPRHPARGCEHGSSDEPPSSPLPLAKVFIDDYCADCHNEKLKRGGLALTALDVERIGDQPRDLGERRPQAPGSLHAAGRSRATGRGDLRPRGREPGGGPRSGGCGAARSGRHARAPPSQPHRVQKRHPRSPRARRRRLGAVAQGRIEPRLRQRRRRPASTRACSSATSRRRRRSAGSPSEVRCARRPPRSFELAGRSDARGVRRGAAVRHPRRSRGEPRLPARRRLRDPAPDRCGATVRASTRSTSRTSSSSLSTANR